jgi:cytochrome c biogenesis factor
VIVETGHYALALALAVTLLQSVLPIWGTRRGDLGLASMAVPAAITQFALVAYAFAALTYAHVVSDFSLVTVVDNSHTTKPLVYKIAGVWGNHEGSMLLWVLILAIFGAAVASFGRGMADELRANTLAVQGWIAFAFLSFILLTSDPFTRRFPAPFEGQDLNPLLQDPGLAIHPPLLYLGYVGFSIVFSFAVAALISGRVDAAWARYIRPWALIAWTFLTLGIAMGSYWAYYTLGWGGFWFWDPVENASLMPWLAGTALLHSAAVMEKRDALKIWTIFLAILTFSLSLLGTFLVRSGVLTSVHSFASDPSRGLFILAILILFIGGSLVLFFWRGPALRPGGLFAPVSREGALVAAALRGGPVLAPIGVGLAVYLILGSSNELVSRIWGKGQAWRATLARATGLPRSAWGTAIAHVGLGVTLLGLAATGWGVERIAAIKPGQTIDLGPYQTTIVKFEERQGPNYSEIGVRAIISRDGSTVTTIEPAKRTFPVRQTTMAEAGIVTLGFGQVYVSLGDLHPDGSIDARMFWKPLVTTIWIGAIVMAIGGIVSLSDRRLRIGFARRAIHDRLSGNPVAPQPAE